MGTHWTEEEIKFLKQNYLEFGSKFCSNYLNRNEKAIVLKANKLNLKRKKRLDVNDINLIIDSYSSGFSTYDIQKIYGFSRSTIRKHLKENQIQIKEYNFWRERNKKYIINEEYFIEIDTQEKAYMLGYFYADGCMISNKQNKRISISLQESDGHILEKFNELIGSTRPLEFVPINKKNKKRKNQIRLNITNCFIYDCFLKHGMKPRKTFDCQFPHFLDEKLKRHFLRGFFDGDGCIYTPNIKKGQYNGAHISIIGYIDMITGICEYLSTFGINIKRLYNITRTENIVTMKLFDNNSFKIFYKLIYEDSIIHLERKHNKFKEWFTGRKNFNDIQIYEFL